mmetsp:Transcript_8944/g.23430  ORF Transcript_8944/g.23430 Transcript_8944/m.23430 type:complete len:244 (+) Transcript_8944:104-835(+)|eukprot:CAMPEP_0185832566 /NCGR_PEP_ID=MMETSP1353-20130828/2153_1 /TAXON_ID=1077150 /ORGANISM="Erythrolobus australicus, Strain CCMP3124" /LENGTH=243 /DNA_ID=CAMNT_0028530745 /DNA_START=88 /DNA_END=819 /DNA_ORIENTATION=+
MAECSEREEGFEVHGGAAGFEVHAGLDGRAAMDLLSYHGFRVGENAGGAQGNCGAAVAMPYWDEIGVQEAVEGLRDELSQLLDPSLAVESILNAACLQDAELALRDLEAASGFARPGPRDVADDSQCSYLTPNTTPELCPNEIPAAAGDLPDLSLGARFALSGLAKFPGAFSDESKLTEATDSHDMLKGTGKKPSTRKKRNSKNADNGGKYEYRKRMANSRPRVNGRFIKIVDKESVLRAMQM